MATLCLDALNWPNGFFVITNYNYWVIFNFIIDVIIDIHYNQHMYVISFANPKGGSGENDIRHAAG